MLVQTLDLTCYLCNTMCDSNDTAQEHIRKPPAGVLRALRKIARGLHPTDGLYGRSEFGGWTATRAAIHRRGLVDWSGDTPALTDAGRAVIAKWP